MQRTRSVVLVLVLLLSLPIVIGGGLMTWALMEVPVAQGERVRAPGGVVGRQASGAYVWFLPSDNGFVLVDAGLDPTGEAIERERGGRTIQAVLLTHAHADHTAGLAALPGVPIYLHAGDRPLLLGEQRPEGWLARIFAMAAPELSIAAADLHEVADGEVIEVDGLRVRATHLPGHTPGSTAWLVDRVLFTGDALLGGPEPKVLGSAFSGDPEQARESLRRLLELDFEVIADGHVGATTAARAALHRMLGEEEQDAAVTLSSEPLSLDGDARTYGGTIEREALYVQAPVADVRGERPAELWLDDGTRWRVAPQPVAEHEQYRDRLVRVTGRPFLDPDGVGAVRVTGVELESISLADDGDAEPGLPRITTLDALTTRVWRWQQVVARLDALEPHTSGAAWGEGRIVFEDGAAAVVAMPIDLAAGSVGETVTMLAQVLPDPEGVRLTAPRVCPGDVPSCPVPTDP